MWIPREVEKEFLGIEKKSRQEALNNASWIKIVDLKNSQSVSVYSRLDPGEAAVFALAADHKPRFIIVDEKKGRQEANKIGLPYKGTVGVLLEAKENGLIGEIKPLLMTLKQNRMHLDESIITEALQKAGEI